MTVAELREKLNEIPRAFDRVHVDVCDMTTDEVYPLDDVDWDGVIVMNPGPGGRPVRDAYIYLQFDSNP